MKKSIATAGETGCKKIWKVLYYEATTKVLKNLKAHLL